MGIYFIIRIDVFFSFLASRDLDALDFLGEKRQSQQNEFGRKLSRLHKSLAFEIPYLQTRSYGRLPALFMLTVLQLLHFISNNEVPSEKRITILDMKIYKFRKSEPASVSFHLSHQN